MTHIRPKRPIGITLLAISFLWIGCVGTITIPFSGFVASASPLLQLMTRLDAHAASWPKVVKYSLLTIWYLLYLAYAVVGFWLWKLRDLGRRAVLGICLLGGLACLVLVPLLVRPEVLAAAILVGTVTPCAWLAWYLKRPRVRFVFKPESYAELPLKLSKSGKFWLCAVIGASFAVYLVLLAVHLEGVVRGSDIYNIAVKRAQNSPCIASVIGTPLTPGWMTTGGLETSGDSGSANLSIPVHGPRGNGTFEIVAEKHSGIWRFTSAVLKSGSHRVEAMPSSDSGCRDLNGAP